MENEEKYKLVFRQGLVINKTKENHVLPIVVANYKLFCERLISENTNADLEQLYRAAAYGLRVLIQNPLDSIPEVTIE